MTSVPVPPPETPEAPLALPDPMEPMVRRWGCAVECVCVELLYLAERTVETVMPSGLCAV